MAYILVATTEYWGEFFKIPIEFLGITLLALGTAIPDISSAMESMKKYGANSALGTAYGFNTFDICIGLGLVYWLKLLFIDYAWYGQNDPHKSILDVYVTLVPADQPDTLIQSFLIRLLIILFSWTLLQRQPKDHCLQNKTQLWIVKKDVELKVILPCTIGYLLYVLYEGLVVFLPQGRQLSWELWGGLATFYSLGILGTKLFESKQARTWIRTRAHHTCSLEPQLFQ